jgi:hypothetical protein
MNWEPINPAKPKVSELICDAPFDIILIPQSARLIAVLPTQTGSAGAERREKVAHGVSRGTAGIKYVTSPGGA